MPHHPHGEESLPNVSVLPSLITGFDFGKRFPVFSVLVLRAMLSNRTCDGERQSPPNLFSIDMGPTEANTHPVVQLLTNVVEMFGRQELQVGSKP